MDTDFWMLTLTHLSNKSGRKVAIPGNKNTPKTNIICIIRNGTIPI